MNPPKQLATSILAGFIFLITCTPGNAGTKTSKDAQELLIEKNRIERVGRAYEKSGDFESAAASYRKAADLDLKIYGSDKGRSLAFLAEVYQKQGEFKKALDLVNSLVEFHPQQTNYYDWKDELIALEEARKSGENKSVYNYIDLYKMKYKLEIPPIKFGIGAISIITRILALYDTIGDYDAGIKYVDEILDYKLSRNKNIVKPESSDQATALSRKKETLQDKKNRRSYEVFAEYLKVRESFLRDKFEGKKGSMKEGKPGRATLALIKSDYFPW